MAKKKVTIVAKKKKAPGAADASSPKAGTKAVAKAGTKTSKKKGILDAIPGMPSLPALPSLPDLLDFPAGVADSAREIWMAGIGALSTVEEAGAEWFEGLVKKGEHWEQESRKALTAASRQAGAAAEGAKQAAGDLAKKPLQWSSAAEAEVQRIVEQSVEGVLHRMNVPTHDEVQDLIQRVQTLTGKVDALSARTKLKATPAKAPASKPKSAAKTTTSKAKPAAKNAAAKNAAPAKQTRTAAPADTVYRVVPHDEGWAVEKEGASRASSVHGTKSEAVGAARDLAKGSEPSRLVVHRQDGTIQDHFSYGA